MNLKMLECLINIEHTFVKLFYFSQSCKVFENKCNLLIDKQLEFSNFNLIIKNIIRKYM